MKKRLQQAVLFSEIVSEIPPKRYRGRPLKYNRADLKKLVVQMGGSETLTVRQQQNMVFAGRAVNIISKREDERSIPLLPYFVGHTTLLAELGRIEREDRLISTAALISRERLKGKSARAEIRKVRHAGRRPNAEVLFKTVWSAVAYFRHLYPAMTVAEAKKHFETVSKMVVSGLNWDL
jgi:hypothetical protein